VYAAFLQNAPVARHTRGFTPGWYAVPRWGTPNASPTQSPSTSTTTHLFDDNYFSSWATITHHRGTGPPINPAAAGPGRSEHWRRSPKPLAQQRESSSSPEPTCERRTDPAERRRGTDPQRQPRHSATAKQVSSPGCMRRSFRTLRLRAIPGVSPRAGMQCPVEALQTPYFPRAPTAPTPAPQQTYSTTIIFPHRQQSTTPIEGQAPNQRSGSGIGPERALEAITQTPRATARKPLLPRASSASAGPIPRSAPPTHSAPSKYRCNHSKIVACHSRLFCGFSTQ